LPIEAEWEYAARAGDRGSRYGDVGAVAWYDDNSGGKTHDVAQKAANAWGLYDTLGNVWGWIADWYTNRDSSGAVTDPSGPASGQCRVLRGGSWLDDSWSARASFRGRVGPVFRYGSVGLRVRRGIDSLYSLLFFLFLGGVSRPIEKFPVETLYNGVMKRKKGKAFSFSVFYEQAAEVMSRLSGSSRVAILRAKLLKRPSATSERRSPYISKASQPMARLSPRRAIRFRDV